MQVGLPSLGEYKKENYMKKILLFALIVCSVCFTACSKRNDIQENIESTSVEENKNSNDGSKNIEKKIKNITA